MYRLFIDDVTGMVFSYHVWERKQNLSPLTERIDITVDTIIVGLKQQLQVKTALVDLWGKNNIPVSVKFNKIIEANDRWDY